MPKSLVAVIERAHDLIFASAGLRTIEALEREYQPREQIEPNGPRVRLVHLAYQAASHELAAKTFDYSPSSIRDRRAAGQSDMAHGLALLDEAADHQHRFKHLAVDPEAAAAAAEVGAKRVAGIGSKTIQADRRTGKVAAYQRPVSGPVTPITLKAEGAFRGTTFGARRIYERGFYHTS